MALLLCNSLENEARKHLFPDVYGPLFCSFVTLISHRTSVSGWALGFWVLKHGSFLGKCVMANDGPSRLSLQSSKIMAVCVSFPLLALRTPDRFLQYTRLADSGVSVT